VKQRRTCWPVPAPGAAPIQTPQAETRPLSVLHGVSSLPHEYSAKNIDQVLGLLLGLMTRKGATPRVKPPDSEPPPAGQPVGCFCQVIQNSPWH
jgi:hypothetical protein